MTERAKKVFKMRKQIFREFENECCFCLRPNPDLSHIFKRSTHPELAAEKLNCIPHCRACHRHFEKMNVMEGVICLNNYSDPSKKKLVNMRLKFVKEVLCIIA